MRIGRWAMFALLASCASLRGGAPPFPGLPVEDARLRRERIAELRISLIGDPLDARAHAVLGLYLQAEGLPGAALRELGLAQALGERAVTGELARLYLARARQRARRPAPSGDAWRDFERALALDASLLSQADDRHEAYFAGGAARWIAGNLEGAQELWRRLPGDSRWGRLAKAALVPTQAALPDLGAAALALASRAPLAARSLLDDYVRRGGKEPHVLAARSRGLVEPASDEGAVHEAALATLAAPPAVAAASGRANRPLSPQAVADVLCVELAAWLWGNHDGFLDDHIPAFVERETEGRPLRDFPAWARPTIARARGDLSGQALLGVTGAVPAYAVPLWAVEQALAGDLGRARALVGEGDAAPLLWLLRARLARVAGDEAAERKAYVALASLDPRSLLFDPLELAPWLGIRVAEPSGFARGWQVLGALPRGAKEGLQARWQRLLGEERLSSWQEPSPLLPLGQGARPIFAERECLDHGAAGAFFALQQALRTDLALVDRLARDYVDAVPSAACRGKDIVALFLRLGDTRRARLWVDELLAEDPGDIRVLLWGVEAAAQAHDAPRAQLYLEEAEYVARRRGAPSLEAVEIFWRAGLLVEAVQAARQALALSSGSARWPAYEKLVAAALRRGREADAQAAWRAYLAVLPARLTGDARLRVRSDLAEARAPSWLDSPPRPEGEWATALLQAEAHAARGESEEARTLLEGMLAWRPASVALRRQLVRLLPVPSTRRYELAAELLFLGVVREGVDGMEALHAWAELAEKDGYSALAEAARAEARAK